MCPPNIEPLDARGAVSVLLINHELKDSRRHSWKTPKSDPQTNFLEATVCRFQGPNDGKVLMGGRSKYYKAFYAKKNYPIFLLILYHPVLLFALHKIDLKVYN